ncbi:hypothetical protein AVEN_118493-1 [Araneus ventricosus]|uniref:Uncharacterized protein n=1 Tax=Araneus ventricosus TaxID=182803 RepID=A0A4Y2NS49_ARAVE|nr:hypothetical protein AVEN_118493-1 [Araneus ventricosus]
MTSGPKDRSPKRLKKFRPPPPRAAQKYRQASVVLLGLFGCCRVDPRTATNIPLSGFGSMLLPDVPKSIQFPVHVLKRSIPISLSHTEC